MAEKEKPVKKKPIKKKKEPVKKKKETVEKKKEPKKKESIKKEKKRENKERKVIVEITPAEKENNEELYSSKLKNLLFKIKNQNSFNDTGIRFAWRN